jgi:hypothetical protein
MHDAHLGARRGRGVLCMMRILVVMQRQTEHRPMANRTSIAPPPSPLPSNMHGGHRHAGMKAH